MAAISIQTKRPSFEKVRATHLTQHARRLGSGGAQGPLDGGAPEHWGQGGVLAAADLVFQGVDRDFKAYAAADGKELWSYDMGAPAIAAPIAYQIDGVEYVAVMLGNGGGARPATCTGAGG